VVITFEKNSLEILEILEKEGYTHSRIKHIKMERKPLGAKYQ
jgi:hypothetical protein